MQQPTDPIAADEDAFTLAGTPRRRARPRRRALTPTPEMLEGAPDFAPVPRLRERHDGWTPDRQRAFILLLAQTGSAARAAHRLGMTPESAYFLRKQPGADQFAAGWEAALATGVETLRLAAVDRALNGVPVPIFHRGEQVGERRRYNDRLLMFVLRHHDPDTYGARFGNRVPPHVRREWEEEKAAEEAERQATVRSEDELLAVLKRRLDHVQARELQDRTGHFEDGAGI